MWAHLIVAFDSSKIASFETEGAILACIIGSITKTCPLKQSFGLKGLKMDPDVLVFIGTIIDDFRDGVDSDNSAGAMLDYGGIDDSRRTTNDIKMVEQRLECMRF